LFELLQGRGAVADRRYFHALIAESEVDDFLNGQRVIGEQ